MASGTVGGIIGGTVAGFGGVKAGAHGCSGGGDDPAAGGAVLPGRAKGTAVGGVDSTADVALSSCVSSSDHNGPKGSSFCGCTVDAGLRSTRGGLMPRRLRPEDVFGEGGATTWRALRRGRGCQRTKARAPEVELVLDRATAGAIDPAVIVFRRQQRVKLT